MTTALTTADSLTNLPSTDVVDLSKYGSETNFLSRLQLVTKGKFVDKGKIAPGHYGVPSGEDEIVDLGATVDVLVLAVRDKALDTSESPPIAVFDENDEFFQDIKERSGGQNSGCMYGPSFLMFERNSGTFYEFFCMNKSSRQEAYNIGQFLPVSEASAKKNKTKAHGAIPCTLKAKYIEKPSYSWHAPQTGKCSTPITNLPERSVIDEQIERFINPKSNSPEIADEKGSR